MPLIRYAQYLTYADGNPVADSTALVNLVGGNVAVPVFADKAGTTPLTNPVPTDSDGLLAFYAAPGAFYTDISGTLFHYPVDASETDPAWPGTFVHDQASASSTWTVAHHFGVEPSVNVIVAGQAVQADVAHPDDETTTISFGAPATGTAYLRR